MHVSTCVYVCVRAHMRVQMLAKGSEEKQGRIRRCRVVCGMEDTAVLTVREGISEEMPLIFFKVYLF